MNCIDYRRLITSTPSHTGADVLRHRLACSPCAAYYRQMQQLDADLRTAMTVNTPRDLESQIMMKAAGQTTARRRWIGIAATLALAVGATLTAVNMRYTIEKLPGQVVQHLYHEAELLVPVSTELVPAPRLNKVLRRTGINLVRSVDKVIHAGICYFRGHLVSHLVVLGEHGPVTVLLLPDEKVVNMTPIDEDGFRGMIVPVQGGSIAVIGSKSPYPAQIEKQFIDAVEWET